MIKVIIQFLEILFIFALIAPIKAKTDLNCTIYPRNPNQTCCPIPSFFDDKDIQKCANRSVNVMRNVSIPTAASSSSRNVSNTAVNLTVLAEKCLQYECLAKKFQFINDEKKFIAEPLINLIVNRLRKAGNVQWIHSISTAIEFCVADVEKDEFDVVETYQAAPFNITVDLCHPKHIALFQCIQIKTFIDCPLVIFNKIEDCFDWKDYAIFCVKNFKNLPLIDLSKIL